MLEDLSNRSRRSRSIWDLEERIMERGIERFAHGSELLHSKLSEHLLEVLVSHLDTQDKGSQRRIHTWSGEEGNTVSVT